jgi:hypothetical protein
MRTLSDLPRATDCSEKEPREAQAIVRLDRDMVRHNRSPQAPHEQHTIISVLSRDLGDGIAYLVPDLWKSFAP